MGLTCTRGQLQLARPVPPARRPLIRIYVSSHGVELGGAELSLQALVQVLVSDGHQVLVTLPVTSEDANHVEAYAGAKVEVVPTHRWMGRRQKGVVGAVRLLQCLPDVGRHMLRMRFYRPDLVVVNTATIPSPLAAARLMRIPVALLIRETLLTNPSLRSVLPRNCIRRILNELSTVAILNSEYAAAQYGFPAHVVYPPVRRTFEQTRGKTSQRRSRDRLEIVMIGSLTPDKGQVDAVTAVALAREQGVDLRLRLYGTGTPRDVEEVERHISRLGLRDVVSYEGPTARPEVVLAEADVSLVCSRNEAYGKVTVESLLSGTPVIGYGLGGTLEILQHGGGISTAPSPSFMADAIVQICRDGTLDELKLQAVSNLAARASLRSDRTLADLVVATAGSLTS